MVQRSFEWRGDRRQLLALGAGAAAFLSGCDSRTPRAARPPAKPGDPWIGGTLRVAQVGDVGTSDGHLNAGYDSFWLTYDRLIRYDSQMNPLPMLAKGWEVENDGQRIILHLRDDVKFHTGRPFTSADVKYNFERIRQPSIGAGALARQARWFDVSTPDRHTAVLSSGQPRPSAFDLLEYLNMVDRETMERQDAKGRAVGTGPFILQEWNPGIDIRFVRNPHYWDNPRPYLDEIIVVITPDPLSLVAQLEAGAVDMINRVQARDLLRLERSSDFRTLTNQHAPIYAMTVNTTLAPFNNKDVRKALSYALDRKRFVRTILGGLARPQLLPWPDDAFPFPMDRPDIEAAYDLDKARFYLKRAGVGRFSLDMIWSSSYGDLKGLAEIYQGDLAKIGIDAKLRPLEANLWRAEQQGPSYKGLNLTFVGPTHLHPQTVLELRNYAPTGNAAGFSSPAYTALAEEVRRTGDERRLQSLIARLNEFFLDEMFVIPVSGHPVSIVTRRNVKGVEYTMHEALRFDRAWIEQA